MCLICRVCIIMRCTYILFANTRGKAVKVAAGCVARQQRPPRGFPPPAGACPGYNQPPTHTRGRTDRERASRSQHRRLAHRLDARCWPCIAVAAPQSFVQLSAYLSSRTSIHSRGVASYAHPWRWLTRLALCLTLCQDSAYDHAASSRGGSVGWSALHDKRD